MGMPPIQPSNATTKKPDRAFDSTPGKPDLGATVKSAYDPKRTLAIAAADAIRVTQVSIARLR